MDDVKDVNETSSPSLGEAIASTPEAQQQAQETQNPTAEQGETQEQVEQQTEESRIPYSRLKEVVDEKNWYKQQMEQMLQQRQSQQQFPQPTQSEELGSTPEEREFWRMQRKVAREEAEKVAREQIVPIQRQIQLGAQEFARQKVDDFRKNHPDVKPGSQEEMLIAQKISEASRVGFSLSGDEAYSMIMGARGMRAAEEKGKQQAKQQTVAKKQANVENSASVPVKAQAAPKRTFAETFEHNWELASQGKL